MCVCVCMCVVCVCVCVCVLSVCVCVCTGTHKGSSTRQTCRDSPPPDSHTPEQDPDTSHYGLVYPHTDDCQAQPQSHSQLQTHTHTDTFTNRVWNPLASLQQLTIVVKDEHLMHQVHSRHTGGGAEVGERHRLEQRFGLIIIHYVNVEA